MFSAKLKVEPVNEFQAVILAGYGNRLILEILIYPSLLQNNYI